MYLWSSARKCHLPHWPCVHYNYPGSALGTTLPTAPTPGKLGNWVGCKNTVIAKVLKFLGMTGEQLGMVQQMSICINDKGFSQEKLISLKEEVRPDTLDLQPRWSTKGWCDSKCQVHFSVHSQPYLSFLPPCK